MPVHGEWRHLRANSEIAVATGVDPRNVVIAQDGVTVDLVRGRATLSGKVEAGLVFVDGDSVGGITEEDLVERRRLAEEGVVTILAIIDPDNGNMVEAPEFFTKGFSCSDEDLDKAGAAVEKALRDAASNRQGGRRQDPEEIIERATANWMRRFYNRQPVVTAIVVDA